MVARRVFWGARGAALWLVGLTFLLGPWAAHALEVPPERDDPDWRIAEIYIATMGYAPDAEGLDYWEDNLVTDPEWTPRTVAQSFFDQPLVQAEYPESLGYGPLIEALYQNIFGRAADAEGYDYWLDELESGRVQRNDMIMALLNGGWANPDAATDMARFGNQVEVSLEFAAYQRDMGIVYSHLDAAEREQLRQIGRDILAPVTDSAQSVSIAIATMHDLVDAMVAEEEGPELNWTGRYVTDTGLAWASRRNLTSQQFSEWFNHYRDHGYIIVNTGAKPEGRGAVYSMVWRENVDDRDWAHFRNMTSDEYNDVWNELRDQGYRPLDVEGYLIQPAPFLPGDLRFSGIWVENREGLAWTSRRNMTSEQYGEYFEESRDAGYRPIDIEAYDTPSGLRFAAIWYENVDNLAWAQYRNMTRQQYLQRADELGAQGYRVIDFESYGTPNGQRYAAIWERPNENYAYQLRTNRDSLAFANLWREYADTGYRLVGLDHFDTDSGDLFGGIWIENAARLRHPARSTLNSTVSQYLEKYELPGISVAIIHEGDVIYRRGEGYADQETGKVAHSRTVYNIASVAKVIGGTLAARLEAEDELQDGSPVDLNLTRPTSDYLTNMPIPAPQGGTQWVSIPAHHTHSVEQLFGHIACVPHYDTTPAIPNRTDHFSSASEAVVDIWDVQLVDGCNVGSTWEYSTAAFTFAGAVLEQAAGEPIQDLLHTELSEPFGLSSIRAMFAEETLPANYDRAVAYTNSNSPWDPDRDGSNYQDNSWKVLGGGIEAHALDLARFAWGVLDAQIVDEDTRDDRLWSNVGPYNHYLGWRPFTDDAGRSFIGHGGSWTGAGARLHVYPDDDLVIAVLSNRSGGSQHIRTLIDGLANDVLGAPAP